MSEQDSSRETNFEGDVSVGRDLIAGDQNVSGDLVQGDKVGRDKITLGDVASSVVAIGDGAQIIYQNVERALTQLEQFEQAEQAEVQRLAEAVTDYVQRLTKQATNVDDKPTGGGPYKSLLEYDVDDAALFYGRSEAIAQALSLIERDEITVLHAESGAGKTSLLKAGIIPRLLANGDVPIYVRPYTSLVDFAVKRAILPQLEQSPGLAIASLRDFLGMTSRILGAGRLVIILDQFEEFFTLQSQAYRDEFIDQLAAAVNDDTLRVRWLLSMRSEWFSQLGTFRPRIRNPYANEMLLRKLNQGEAREIIVEPAARYEVGYQEGLVENILTDLGGGGEIDPPQLQLVCAALYDGRGGRAQITRNMYEDLGGTVGILRSHLERVLSREVPVDERGAARAILQALISTTQRRVRRTAEELEQELSVLRIQSDTTASALDRLVESRLLRTAEDEQGVSVYELAHDYLLDKIEIDPATQARKAAQDLLEQEVAAYQRYGTMLTPEKLVIIEAQKEQLVIDETAADLLARSERELVRRRRLFRVGFVAVLVLVVLAILSGIGIIQANELALEANQQAQVANQRRAEIEVLAEQAAGESAAAQATADAAEIIAADAAALADEADARAAESLQVLSAIFQQNNFVAVGAAPYEVTWAGGDSVWATSCNDPLLQQIDVSTGLLKTRIPFDPGTCPNFMYYDGQWLWMGMFSGQAIYRVNPETADFSGPIVMEGRVREMVSDNAGRLWAISDGATSVPDTLVQIDRDRMSIVGSVTVGGGPQTLTYDGNSLWVTSTDSSLLQRVDPDSRTVTNSYEMSSVPLGVRWAGDSLWVTLILENVLAEIDPGTGSVLRTYDLSLDGQASLPSRMTYDGVSLWVLSQGGNVIQQFDTRTREVVGAFEVGQQPLGAAWDPVDGTIWVANAQDNNVQRIHPLQAANVSDLLTGAGPTALVPFDGLLWAANSRDNSVVAIDENGAITATYPVGNTPLALVPWDGWLWVLNSTDGTVQGIPSTAVSEAQDFADIGLVTAYPGPLALAPGAAHLWILAAGDASNSAALVGYNRGAGAVDVTVPLDVDPVSMQATTDDLWLTGVTVDGTGQLLRFDLTTQTITSRTTLPGIPTAMEITGDQIVIAMNNVLEDGGAGIAVYDTTFGSQSGDLIATAASLSDLLYADGQLWATSEADAVIQSIDLESGAVWFEWPVEARPTAIAIYQGDLWAAYDSDGIVRRYAADALERYEAALVASRE